MTNELYRRRSVALQEFLDANAELYSVAESEDVDIEGPEIITGAILILRSRYAGGEGELSLSVNVPYALGISEEMGMIQHQAMRLSARVLDTGDD